MPKRAVLTVKDEGVSATIKEFLKELLEKDIVEALLVPVALPAKTMVNPVLVSDPGMLQDASPLAPVMPVSTARVVSDLTKIAPSGKKMGVVMRSCELRALVELVKLKQAALDNLLLIGIDCFGTYSVANYGTLSRETSDTAVEFLKRVKDGGDTHLREACQICEYPAPLHADLVIGLFGLDLGQNILVEAVSEEGEGVLDTLEYAEAEAGLVQARDAAISEMAAARKKRKEELFAEYQGELSGLDNLTTALSPCIDCHNCRVACPLCYCRECFFDSPTFDWAAEKYLGWADKRGALAMPTDRLLFHLTRLNHMVASCVGCGLCQEACPSDVNVFRMFRMTGDEVQKSFDYVPGRSLEDELPLSVFREDELSEVGA